MEQRPASEQYVEAWVEDQLRQRVLHQLAVNSEVQDDLYTWANLGQPIAESTKQGPSYDSINSAPKQPASAATAYVSDEVSFWRLLILLPLATFVWSGLSILLDLNSCKYVGIRGGGRLVRFNCSPIQSVYPSGVELPGILVGLVLVLGYVAIAAWALAPVIRNYRQTHSAPATGTKRASMPTARPMQEPKRMIGQPRTAPNTSHADSIEKRLDRLSSLLAKGVIDKSEYEHKRQAIIDEL